MAAQITCKSRSMRVRFGAALADGVHDGAFLEGHFLLHKAPLVQAFGYSTPFC